ncbi:hypothetical protein BT93_H1008 [Corymbia citriodora subsp. variegata]|nr:hypothetical protein BT93_H1008 [Corymbia citriodora subsp. variegata]
MAPIGQKTEDGKSGSKRVGVERGHKFPLILHLDEVDQDRNKKGENSVEGTEGRETSDVCWGMMAGRHRGGLLKDP